MHQFLIINLIFVRFFLFNGWRKRVGGAFTSSTTALMKVTLAFIWWPLAGGGIWLNWTCTSLTDSTTLPFLDRLKTSSHSNLLSLFISKYWGTLHSLTNYKSDERITSQCGISIFFRDQFSEGIKMAILLVKCIEEKS